MGRIGTVGAVVVTVAAAGCTVDGVAHHDDASVDALTSCTRATLHMHDDGEEVGTGEVPGAGNACGAVGSEDGAERTGEAQQASAVGQACRDGCALAYTAACLRVTQVCEGATAVTLGGATVPCATAIYATCLSAVVLARVCAGECPP
jgi:hypothetical protein